MDAILFSANPSMVEVDDAINHLNDHEQLYWSVGFRIDKEKLSFPIFGFIHMSGRQVEYRALVNDIIPFSPEHYRNAKVKPNSWREKWKNEPDTRSYPWKNALIMTEIVPFSYETKKMIKFDGGSIKLAPQAYARVIPPNQPGGSSPALPARKSIDERNLGHFVVAQLEEIEPGLHLVNRELGTPAGRLDLLCRDARGNYVVVELKRSRGTDQVVGQILRYMGWVKEEYPKSNVRGIVIVGKKDSALEYALKAAPGIEAKEFKLSIT